MSRSSLRQLLFVAAALLGLLTASVNVQPGQARPNAAVNVPAPVFPKDTLPIKRIIFIWTSVGGADRYQLQLYQGSSLLFNKVLDQTACVSGTCSFRAPSDLPDGNYAWKVRARVGGTYQPYSVLLAFSVATGGSGFYSPFTSDAVGWVMHKGLWYLEGSNYFTTTGVKGYASTISHVNDYSTLTYEVRMKRDGCAGNANVVAIRGNPVLDSTGWWNTEYTFDYTNTGYFSVWRDSYGTYAALRDWTYTAAITQGGWNTLAVKANGANLYFYINGSLVWSGSDAAYASGRVGIGMYRGSGCAGDKLWVDYAKLDTVSADALKGDVMLDLGDPTPGGTRNTAP